MLAGTNPSVRLFAAAAVLTLCGALLGVTPAAAYPAPATTAVASAGGACGSVEIGATSSKDAWAAYNCFSAAYSSCDAANLSIGYHVGAGGVARTFVTVRNVNDGFCNVAEVVDRYNGPNVKSSDTYLCNEMHQSSDGLTFVKCGTDGDVFVPGDLSSASAQKLITIAVSYQPAG